MRQVGPVALGAQAFHDVLDELLGFAQLAGDEVDVHGGLFRVAGGMAIDTVLADQQQGFGDAVQGHGQAAAPGAQHLFVVLDFCFMLVKGGHRLGAPRSHPRDGGCG